MLEPRATSPSAAEGGTKADQEFARRLALCDTLLAQLTSDEDEYYKFQRRLLLQLIAQNRLSEMMSRLKTFGPSYQAPLAAEIALELFRAGKLAESSALLEQARKALALSDTWKVDRAREFLTLLALEQGNAKEAQEGFNRMTDESSKANYLSRFHILADNPAQEQVEAFLAKPPERASSYQTRLLLHLGRQKAHQNEPATAEALFNQAMELTFASKNTQALEDVIEIADAMAAAGLIEQARKTIKVYLVICRKYPTDSEWKALSIYKAVALLHRLGDRAGLPALFVEAEASARATFFLWAPAAWIACSKIALLIDQPTETDRCLAEAADNARAYQHPRGRVMGLAEIALHLLENPRPVPDSLFDALKP